MANYPDSQFNPRVHTNAPGVVYVPANETIQYSEDVEACEEEIKAVENDLMQCITQIGGKAKINGEKILKAFDIKQQFGYDANTINSFVPAQYNLPAGVDNVSAMAYANNTEYYLTDIEDSVLYFIKNSPEFSEGYITLPSGCDYGKDMIRIGKYLFCVFDMSPFRLVKIDLDTNEVVDYIDGETGENHGISLTCWLNTVGVGINSTTPMINFYDTTTLEVEQTILMNEGDPAITTIFAMPTILFIGVEGTETKIGYAQLTTFTYYGLFSLGYSYGYVTKMLTDYKYIFLSLSGAGGRILKLAADSGTPSGEFSFGEEYGGLASMCYDGRYIYCALASTPGGIGKVDTLDMSFSGGILTFNSWGGNKAIIFTPYGLRTVNYGTTSKLLSVVPADVFIIVEFT